MCSKPFDAFRTALKGHPNGFGVPISVFDAYKKIAGCDIEESIKDECTGNLEALLLAVGMEIPVVICYLDGLNHHSMMSNRYNRLTAF